MTSTYRAARFPCVMHCFSMSTGCWGPEEYLFIHGIQSFRHTATTNYSVQVSKVPVDPHLPTQVCFRLQTATLCNVVQKSCCVNWTGECRPRIIFFSGGNNNLTSAFLLSGPCFCQLSLLSCFRAHGISIIFWKYPVGSCLLQYMYLLFHVFLLPSRGLQV